MNAFPIKSLCAFVLLMLIPWQGLLAAEVSGRFSMLSSTASAHPGDLGYVDANNHTPAADQQSLRLMLDGGGELGEWSVHLKTLRQHLDGYPTSSSSASLFRYDTMGESWLDENNGVASTYAGYEVDRMVFKHRVGNVDFSIGRQPVDWGTGRFWQPLNVFGAFAPTDLDTDYKPGIDAVVLDWYPSSFSSASAVLAAKPKDNTAVENSGAIHYRRQVGETSELSLLGGSILGNNVAGAAFESAWNGMGWRVEGAYYSLKDTKKEFLYWIAGVDYQFSDGTLIAAEWYDNGNGADSEQAITAMATDPLVLYGLQQQLGRQVLGLTLDRDLTPLLHGSYSLFTAGIRDAQEHLNLSHLHQLTLTYSVSNESDLLFSLLVSDGKGLTGLNGVQSEFGHLPATATLRLRFYF